MSTATQIRLQRLKDKRKTMMNFARKIKAQGYGPDHLEAAIACAKDWSRKYVTLRQDVTMFGHY